jgi:Putative beta-barrel porin-2, OmpL-like. bbp2
MKFIMLILLLGLQTYANAQVDSIRGKIALTGYLETYYSYDFARPANHIRQPFVYSFNRHNEVNLNIGFVKLSYNQTNSRANLALMTGTYSNDNLAGEPGVLKNIFEANAGIKISKSKNLWLDAGIFPSHIGFESAIGKDCWNLTRSMLADNSPYFESGLKVSYTSPNEQWFLSGLFLNGWQRIQRLNGNNSLSLGHQLTYKPNPKVILNSSSFVGSDTPDSTKRMRYFHNFYGQLQLSEKLGLIVGFDIGFQQKSKESSDYHSWYSPVMILKYTINDKWSVATRAEYYEDKNQVIISSNSPNGFQTFGYSFNIDRAISSQVLWRTEARGFSSKDALFRIDTQPSTHNFFLTTSLAISFQ